MTRSVTTATTVTHRSYSQVSQLRTCGWAYKLERLDRVPSRPSCAAVGGTVVHSGTELVDHILHSNPTASRLEVSDWGCLEADKALDAAIAKYAGKDWPVDTWRMYGKQDIAWFRETGIPNSVRAYTDWRFDNPEFVLAEIPGFGPAIEVPFNYFIDGQLIHGWIDRIFTNADGSDFYPVDLKGLDVNTPIPTPSGWATMGSLQVGDQVLGSNGEPCEVTRKSQPRRIDCYRVLFDDGTSVVCDSEHLWETTSGGSSPGAKRVTAVRGVREIQRTLRRNGRRQHRVRLTEPLRLPAADLPIEPYALGVWLGDGRAKSGEFTKPDPEIADELRRQGSRVREVTTPNDRCRRWLIEGLTKQLRIAGLQFNKHVPDVYLRGSILQRLALLRGLMDTDGTYNKARRSVTFTSTDKSLREAVAELALSLGERVYRFDVERTGFSKTVTSHDVRWTPTNYNPFTMPRKADQVILRRHGQSLRRMIVSIEQTITVTTQCIAVDSHDNTYLAGDDFVVTHNSGLKPKTDEQLGLYAAALSADSNLDWPPVTWGYYLYALKTGTAKVAGPLKVNHWTAEKLRGVYLSATQAIEQGIFMPHPGEACMHCGVSASCQFVQAAL